MATVTEIRRACADVDPETPIYHMGTLTNVTVGGLLERLRDMGGDEIIVALGAEDDRPPMLNGDRMVWG